MQFDMYGTSKYLFTRPTVCHLFIQVKTYESHYHSKHLTNRWMCIYVTSTTVSQAPRDRGHLVTGDTSTNITTSKNLMWLIDYGNLTNCYKKITVQTLHFS